MSTKRKFVCMLNIDQGMFNGVYEEVNGQLVGYGDGGIEELFGMNCVEVEQFFASKGEVVITDMAEFS